MAHRAAIITAVNPFFEASLQIADLAVLNPEGFFFNRNVPQNETTKVGGSWHWPEREDE
jgi:hypothetical protein